MDNGMQAIVNKIFGYQIYVMELIYLLNCLHMNNEIKFANGKVNFLAQTVSSNTDKNLDLHKVVAKKIDVNCVKCGKPLDLNFKEKLMRCPFCSDFFKPKAQLIFQIEEKINKLSTEHPVTFFLISKNVKVFMLVLLFLGFINYENLISLGFFVLTISLVFYEIYTSKNKKIKEFRYLNNILRELELDYQKNK